MRALNQSVNLSNPLELRSGDVFGKMVVEDANVRHFNIEECFGFPINIHNTYWPVTDQLNET